MSKMPAFIRSKIYVIIGLPLFLIYVGVMAQVLPMGAFVPQGGGSPSIGVQYALNVSNGSGGWLDTGCNVLPATPYQVNCPAITFTNSEHTLGGWQYFPDSHYSNVDVSSLTSFPIDYGSPTWVGLLAPTVGSITAASWSGGVVSATLVSTSGITNGQGIQILNVNPTGYNSTQAAPFPTVTVVDGTHITYPLTGNPGTYVSGGQVFYNNGNRMGVAKGMAINLATNATATPAIVTSNTNFWTNDPGPFPITTSMIVEGGGTVASPGSCGDCHLLVLNTDTGILYEGGNIASTSAPFTLGAIAVWNLQSNNLRTNYTSFFTSGPNTDTTGITSSDVAGTPIAPLVLTHAELYSGCPGGVGTCNHVKHMLRITFGNSGGNGGYVWPATHASSTAAIPVGTRWTLPAGYSSTCLHYDQIGQSFASYPPIASLIWTLQHYGAMFTDYGSTGLVTTDADPAWGNGGGSDNTNMSLWTHCILSSELQVVHETPTQGINLGAIK